MPAKAMSLPRRPPEKFGSSDGANGAATALASEACGWPAILLAKIRTGMLLAVCGGGSDCVEFREARPCQKVEPVATAGCIRIIRQTAER